MHNVKSLVHALFLKIKLMTKLKHILVIKDPSEYRTNSDLNFVMTTGIHGRFRSLGRAVRQLT